ncbi:type III-A CRISPR-associated RAMP protein Csm3 [Methanothermococcus sp. SCGC AD-155-C09]|nr:type III-A CRISPR-associated RAMP protein Csm3 [Methanothermococcus sp. SCGC AD-155-C09]
MDNNGKILKLKGKLIITGTIEAVTGLHIGGTSETLKIGGSDNPVIKDKNGMAFIPGSSLKGKIRSLLEISGCSEKDYYVSEKDGKSKENNNSKENNKSKGEDDKSKEDNKPKNDGNPCGCGTCDICLIFGPHDSKSIKEPRRVIVRDGYIKNVKDTSELYEKLEAKVENTIDRVKGTTNQGGVRTMERVVAGSEFDYEVIFNIYNKRDKELINTFLKGMKLLEDDYLGGNGSRGYGKIKFKDLMAEHKPISFYESGKGYKKLLDKSTNNIDDLINGINNELKIN